MPGPHDPNHASSAGLALSDTGEETGEHTSAQEANAVKAPRTPPRFWLGMAALVLGLAALASGLIFFLSWPGVLAVESLGAGLALLIIGILLLAGRWRSAASRPQTPAVAPDAAMDTPAEASSAAMPAPPDLAPPATPESPAAPAPTPTPAPEQAPDAAPASAAQTESSATAAAEAPAAPSTPPEPTSKAAPVRKPSRAKTGQPAQNGHTGPMRATRPKAPANDATPPARPALTNLPQSYPRPSGGYTLDAEAEDLSQLLGDVAEQTVIAIATRGQRGVERRERMASKIDTFSAEMAVDPTYAPVAAFLESISALLRAGKAIPASKTLVDPFDGLYGYVLILIRRKTGQTHDE